MSTPVTVLVFIQTAWGAGQTHIDTEYNFYSLFVRFGGDRWLVVRAEEPAPAFPTPWPNAAPHFVATLFCARRQGRKSAS